MGGGRDLLEGDGDPYFRLPPFLIFVFLETYLYLFVKSICLLKVFVC